MALSIIGGRVAPLLARSGRPFVSRIGGFFRRNPKTTFAAGGAVGIGASRVTAGQTVLPSIPINRTLNNVSETAGNIAKAGVVVGALAIGAYVLTRKGK